MTEICVIALLSLAIALYAQARWTASAIRRRRSLSRTGLLSEP